MFLAFFFGMFIMLAGTVSAIPVIAQTNSTTMVYTDPPTINGTAIDQEFTVNINIRDAQDIYSWQAGMTFNPDALNCTGFFEGEFLKSAAPPGATNWINATINNTLGWITAHGCHFLGDYSATGDGQLAYLTFKVKATGVSDLHLRNAKVLDYDLNEVPTNIVDVYTVVVNATPHKVVTVSNSTGTIEEPPGSGFGNHSFSLPDEEISFKVTGPYPSFSNITIPKTLLNVSTLDEWKVIIDGAPLSTEDRTVTENATHSSIYFTYASGIHEVGITTRGIESSTISIDLSSNSIDLESDVTISGEISPERVNVTVTIFYRRSGGTWNTLGTSQTDSNSRYSYTWTPGEAGTYEIKASWLGDPNTEGDESDVKTLTVKGPSEGIDPYILAAVVVAIIVVIAIIVYFVKFRKPEEE